MKRLGQGILLAVVLLSLGLPFAQARDAKGDEIIKQVLAAWEKRRKAIKTIQYQLKGTMTFTKGSCTEDDPQNHPNMRTCFPPNDYRYECSYKYALDFVTPRMRKAYHGMILYVSAGKFIPIEHYQFFDGKNGYHYRPSDRNDPVTPNSKNFPIAVRYDGPSNWLFGSQENYPILYAAGVPPLYGVIKDEAAHFKQMYPPDLFVYDGRMTIDGVSCDVLRTIPETGTSGRYDKFVVDTTKDAAIVHWMLMNRNEPFRVYDVKYQHSNGHWLPRSWTFSRFSRKTGVRQLHDTESLQVIDIIINESLNASLFVPQLQEGDVMEDTGTNSRKRVASDNVTLVPINASTKIRLWWHWLILGIGVLGILYFLYWICTRSRFEFDPMTK